MNDNTVSIDWNASDGFYMHLKELWTAEFDARKRVNEVSLVKEQAKALEDWYEAVDTMSCRIEPYVNEFIDDLSDEKAKEYKKLSVYFTTISNLTGGMNFMQIEDPEVLYEIKDCIREYSRACFFYMAKLGMLLKSKAKANINEAWG